jgi:hypothetical protein
MLCSVPTPASNVYRITSLILSPTPNYTPHTLPSHAMDTFTFLDTIFQPTPDCEPVGDDFNPVDQESRRGMGYYCIIS